MGNYEQLKEAIKAVIKTNGKQEITGQIMQDTLLAITSSFGQGALFAGIATPETNPLTPDQNVFYLASQSGVYPNFNGLSVNDGEIVVFSLSAGQWTKQILSLGGGGSVTIINEPDEEDLTTVPQSAEKNVIRFKNRIYDEANASGKGYKILRKYWKEVNGVRKNILTQDMINDANTVYEIRYDFDLNGAEINIPDGCVLKFVGGSFKNGTVNNAVIDYSGNNKIFTNLNFDRLYSLQDVRPEWFGASGDGETDDTEALRITFFTCNYKGTTSDMDGCRVLCNPKKYYKISGNINHYNGEDYVLDLNCVGNVPPITTPYNHINNITFMLTEGTSMFQNAQICGNLNNCKIVLQGDSTDNTYIFNNCECYNLDFSYNTIDRVGAFLYNTTLQHITKIHDNRIVAEYFAKVDKTNSGLVDSFIFNNYISGDVGRTANIDNYCFG